MNILDIVLLVCLIPALIQGLRKGFIAQVVAIISLVLGGWLAYKFSAVVTEWLAQWLDITGQALNIISFILIFAVVVTLLFLLGKILEASVKIILLGWLNKLMRRGGPRRCRGVRRKGAATTGMDGLERALGEVVNGGADGRGAGGVGADGGVFVKQGLRINLEEGAVLTDKAAAVDGGGDFVEGLGFEGFDDACHEVGALGDVLHGPAVRKTVLLEGLTECHWGPRGLGGE